MKVLYSPNFSTYIDEQLMNMAITFNRNGFPLYIVGGSVRDYLLNKVPKDIDLCTSATYEDIIKMYPNDVVMNVGVAFGVTLLHGYEIATFRQDITTGRNPEVKLITNFGIDSLRRDFTINALYYDIVSRKIIDFHTGIDDIENKIIRTVGNPTDRFNEDRLRVLRAIRFSCLLNFDIEHQTLIAMQELSLQEVSNDRIIAELTRTFNNSSYSNRMECIKYYQKYLPELIGNYNPKECDWLVQLDMNCELNLLMLIGFIASYYPVDNIALLKRNGFSNEQIKYVVLFVLIHKFLTDDDFESVLTIITKYKPYTDVIEICGKILNHKKMMDLYQVIKAYEPICTSQELLDDGFIPNAELGIEMRYRNTNHIKDLYVGLQQ